jgi:hypothetical protein
VLGCLLTGATSADFFYTSLSLFITVFLYDTFFSWDFEIICDLRYGMYCVLLACYFKMSYCDYGT